MRPKLPAGHLVRETDDSPIRGPLALRSVVLVSARTALGRSGADQNEAVGEREQLATCRGWVRHDRHAPTVRPPVGRDAPLDGHRRPWCAGGRSRCRRAVPLDRRAPHLAVRRQPAVPGPRTGRGGGGGTSVGGGGRCRGRRLRRCRRGGRRRSSRRGRRRAVAWPPWRGSSTVDQVVAWSAEKGLPSVTLTTFRDVPWNAPYYERLGFTVVESLSSALQVLIDDQATWGLDPSLRVVMRREVRS